MANLNIRNVSDDLYHRVRAAAACGAARIPKGALEKWVHRALLRAVESKEPGLGAPRIKLCSGCFQRNQEALHAYQERTAPPSTNEVAQRIPLPPPKAAENVFSHLLAEDEDSMAAAGMAGFNFDDMPAPETLQVTPAQSFTPYSVEVMPMLWVGNEASTQDNGIFLIAKAGKLWSVLSAAKEPWHREMVGYQTKSAPEGPERLVARRGNHMTLNLIDVRELGPGGVHYVSNEAIEAGLDFIHERLEAGDKVLVHDVKGVSMAPAIAMLYMVGEGQLPLDAPFPAFREIYPAFDPGAGVTKYLQQRSEIA